MENQETTQPASTTPISVGSIRVQANDKVYEFRPTENISPLHVSKFLILFFSAFAHNRPEPLDIWSYIQSNSLIEHFVEITENAQSE